MEGEGVDRTDIATPNTTSVSPTKSFTPARVSLKRTLRLTPNPAGSTFADGTPTSSSFESPLLKRLCAEAPAKEQLSSRSGNSSLPSSELIDENAAKESTTEVVGQKRRRQRPRSISLTLAKTEKKAEAMTRSAGAKVSDSSDSNLPIIALRTRSATRSASLTRADTAALCTRGTTRTRLYNDADAGGKSTIRTSPATRTAAVESLKSRTASNRHTQFAPRAETDTQAASEMCTTTGATSAVRAKKHGDTTLADDKTNSAPKEKRRKSNNGETFNTTPSVAGRGVMTRRRVSISGGQQGDTGDTSENEAVNNVMQSRRSLRDKTGADSANYAHIAASSKAQQQPSKIPVRASTSTFMKTRYAIRQVSSSMVLAPKAVDSNSSSGSGNSGTEGAMKTMGAVLLRKRALATKVTRINLAHRTKGNPVPMELARPTRLRAPASNLPASNLRAKKR